MDKRALGCLAVLFALLGAVSGAGAGVLDRLNGLSGGAPEFLDPAIAFRLNHAVVDGVLQLSFEIEPGYYLYRDKMSLLPTAATISLGELQRPAGEMKDDPEFGPVAIYRDNTTLRAPLGAAAGSTAPLAVTVGYQGCAEDGICYPPIKRAITLTAADLAASAAAPLAAALPTDGQPATSGEGRLSADDIAASLSGRSLLAVCGTFFVFGLLLAFTPCVFPMVPILSGIIVGQAQPVSTRRGLVLSAVYVLAVAVTYSLVGLAAGLFGHNLQATFQQPAVIIAFSLVFVALSLSMFGFYELQLPAALQTRLDALSRTQRGGNLVGVALMGLLSAIIVGPCVAPPLAGALIYLSHEGSAVTGGGALFALGLGMGAPLLLVGASAGQLLPRAGAWMDAVKKVFGVLLLAVAIWFLERILPGPVTLGLWAVLAISSAVYLGAFDALVPADAGWRRLSKGLGLAMLTYGVVLLVGAGAGADDPFNPLGPLANREAAAAEELPFEAIKGLPGLEAGIARARAAGRPVMLDFYADWCIECKHLERQTFRHASVQAALRDVVLLRADVTANDDADRDLLQRFQLFGPP
ncbi:MAG: protein-disulfide reductase DsbD, partial [Gammaproteobacteria bacterium]